jgi:hypothetical protein
VDAPHDELSGKTVNETVPFDFQPTLVGETISLVEHVYYRIDAPPEP